MKSVNINCWESFQLRPFNWSQTLPSYAASIAKDGYFWKEINYNGRRKKEIKKNSDKRPHLGYRIHF